jgi:hypothetical protein
MRRNRNQRKRGGAATAFPLHYFGAKEPFAADAGRDLLRASDMGIRPSFLQKMGGRRSHKRKGGFYPSVMGDFTLSASKYIVPMALYAGYKMMRTSKSKRRTRRR